MTWLQVLTLRPLLEDKKLVFLIGDEISQYPIDFKERFGIDYTQYPVRPLGVREVNRLIFHTQFSSHNGGDFFNEIFDGHPNMLTLDSVMFDSFDETFAIIRQRLREAKNLAEAQQMFQLWNNPRLIEEMYHMKNPTEKDLMVIYYLRDNLDNGKLELAQDPR